MSTITINVNKDLDGYTFSITPSIRKFIKHLFPNSRPANRIFVAYDTKSDFDTYRDEIEQDIFPILLGMRKTGLKKNINKINFVDTETGSTLYEINL